MVVGGEDDGDSNLKTAEWYDTSAGQWRALPDMSVAREGCVAVCIEGNVYVAVSYIHMTLPANLRVEVFGGVWSPQK